MVSSEFLNAPQMPTRVNCAVAGGEEAQLIALCTATTVEAGVSVLASSVPRDFAVHEPVTLADRV